MGERGRPRRRRAVVLGVPAAIVAVLAIVALLRVGSPGDEGTRPAGSVNADREASLPDLEVRQLTSDRTFWGGEIGETPVFVVAPGPVRLQPGSRVAVTGRVEPAPPIDVAQREWRVNEATARAVAELGTYVRAREIAGPR